MCHSYSSIICSLIHPSIILPSIYLPSIHLLTHPFISILIFHQPPHSSNIYSFIHISLSNLYPSTLHSLSLPIHSFIQYWLILVIANCSQLPTLSQIPTRSWRTVSFRVVHISHVGQNSVPWYQNTHASFTKYQVHIRSFSRKEDSEELELA